ncbi:type II secretion system secretin GspD [Caulobacter flavus]|uniref:type II secretion system secretin GspD n=1 Tax=Caulobacter flavus TaxID=1679497 RepID=UPI0013DE56A5|nr:type II secretion system secretin GspD [Caulobacter flavus]
MIARSSLAAGLCLTSLLPGQVLAQPAAPPPAVRATVLPGQGGYPAAPSVSRPPPRPGPVSLNLPGVEVQDFAKAALGDALGLRYAVAPSARGRVSLVTPRAVAAADALGLIEEALRNAGLALVLSGGVYTVTPLAEARGQSAALDASQPGYGSEVIALSFANAEELRKLLEPIAPGVIVAADAPGRTLTIAGSTGQRRTVRDLVQQFDVDWLRGMSFALYVPQNTDARLIAPELEKLINAPGAPTAGMVRLLAMERLNGIIAISAQRQYLDDVKRWIEVLDHEGRSNERRLYVYRVQNGRAADLAKVLAAAFGGEAAGAAEGATIAGDQRSGGLIAQMQNAQSASASGQTLPGQAPTPAAQSMRMGGLDAQLTITSDETNNAIVAFATPREYAILEDALRKLDVVPMQVMIEVAITEVTLNDALRYGSQWFFKVNGNQYGLSQGETATPAPTFPGFTYGLRTGSVTAAISALSNVTHVEVLSAPNLLVINNQTASLEVGDQVPISTGSAVNNVSLVSGIDYRDTGVLMKVTPRVNSGGLVLLDIAQEVSDVSPTASSKIDSPTISVRKVATSIAVQDGQTIALGGLIRDNANKARSGVPILGAAPIVGALFGSRDNKRLRTELLVLLTPHVIRNTAEADDVAEELRRKIRAISPKPPKFEP